MSDEVRKKKRKRSNRKGKGVKGECLLTPYIMSSTEDCRRNCQRLLGAEILLANTTDGAYPIFGKVFESGSRLNAIVRVAHLGVVNPSTSITYVLHNKTILVKQ